MFSKKSSAPTQAKTVQATQVKPRSDSPKTEQMRQAVKAN